MDRGRGTGGTSVAVAATLALTLLDVLVRHGRGISGDELIYERMAQHPFATHTFPFGYRIGVPWLVHVSPLSHTTTFVVLAIASAAAAAGCLHALMVTLATPSRVAAVAAVAFAISPVVLVTLIRDGRGVDPETLLVMCAGALFVVRRQGALLCVTLLLGAFVRESALFLIPFAYAVWAQRWLDREALARVLAVALPAIVAYLALRLAIPTVGRSQVAGYGEGLLDGRATVLRTALDDWTVELRRVLLAFGPLWLVAPLALRDMSYARRGMALVACCLVATTFALDWERVLVLAAPVVYPAAGWVLASRRRWRVPVLASWLAVCVGYAVYMQVHGVAHGIDPGSTPTYPVR
jgi:hypothetical protein